MNPSYFDKLNAMGASLKSLGIDRLPVEERLALVEDIWDSIAADSAALPLTDAQRAELDRRLGEHETNPDDVVPWEEVRGSITERLKR
jgi:putative addiction module component (TIGR02574 family)